ncbi:MAG: hypothetical protein LBD23_04230 [Oscillospiraceae bacterium]|jgi:hypothetical protein|nr:hypothetical protein [Oscillospiraceae bacterium]
MIDISDLREIHPVVCYSPKGDTVTFEAIKKLINRTAKAHGISISFDYDEVSSGEGDSIIIENCLVVFHPNHRNDFFNVIFRIRREGDKAFIFKSEYGNSAQLEKTYTLIDAAQDVEKSNSGSDNIDISLLEAEQMYYRALMAIFKYVKC